jgi:hypothetical protein
LEHLPVSLLQGAGSGHLVVCLPARLEYRRMFRIGCGLLLFLDRFVFRIGLKLRVEEDVLRKCGFIAA